MGVLVATDAGAQLVIDVELDNNNDRLVAMNRHLGAPTAWTVNTGVVTAIRDGANELEIEVEVTGPFTGQVKLTAAANLLVSASKSIEVAAAAKAIVRFRLSRAHDREQTLAGAAPDVSTTKTGTAELDATATISASPAVVLISSAALSASGTLTAEPVVIPAP